METKIMTLPFHQNTKSKVRMTCHQMMRPYNFTKTQQIRCGWHEKEAYQPIISVKHKKIRYRWHGIEEYDPFHFIKT